MAFALFVLLPLLLRFGFRANRTVEDAHADRLTQRIEIEITPEGLRVRDAQEELLRYWSAFSRVVDNGYCVYLVGSSDQVLFVPLSAFATREDYDAFVRALQEHVRSDTSAKLSLNKRSRFGLGTGVTVCGLLVMSYAGIWGFNQLEARYPKGSQAFAGDDPFAWLEEEDRVNAWVVKQRGLVTEALAKSPEFGKTSNMLYGLRGHDTQVPELQKIGDKYMNFWRDAKSYYGVWRWTTFEEFKKPSPRWETLIDVDAFNRAEKTAWKWGGASCLPPANNRCLVWLSKDGAQGHAIREYDIANRSWVPDGFQVPLGDVRLTWIDQDAVVADMPSNVQPDPAVLLLPVERRRALKRWRRGTELAEASNVFEGNIAALNRVEPTQKNVVYNAQGEMSWSLIDLAAFPHWMTADGRLARVIAPYRSTIRIHGPWIFIVPNQRWTVGTRTYESGSVLVGDLNSYMQGQRDLTVLFEPTPTSILAQTEPIFTKSHVVLNVLDDVKHRLVVLTPQSGGEWRKRQLPPMPGMNALTVWTVDSKDSDAIWIRSTGFLTPQQLLVQNLDEDAPQLLKSAPHQFDSSKHDVEQRFATSKDGTKIPYFLVNPRERGRDGSVPTLLHAYGGFGVSQLPNYSAEVGKLWLERGGAYVLANIRGGGEYGPRWHEAATKSGRQRVNEDLAAVAQDLMSYGVTSPKHLVMHGISNGGLLAGNMLTQYPQLFAAIVVESGLLDMRGYHRMAKKSTWAEEYGLPEVPLDWDFMKLFSPYHLVNPKLTYPPTLFIAAKDDDVVHPAHARKMTALLQSLGKKAYYLESTQGRHGNHPDVPIDRFKRALTYHFMWEAATTQP